MILQPVWHFLLPAPFGFRNAWLAVLMVLPLFLPLKGLLSGSLRSVTWAGYLAMLYLVIGVTEAWANPAQRIPAMLQVVFVVVFILSALAFSRQAPRKK